MGVDLPTEIEELILQVRGAGDLEFWTIGDISAEMVDELAQTYGSKTLIRISIADLAGLSPSTVAEYESNARHYPREVRSQYDRVFTRWHYRVAKAAGSPVRSLVILRRWHKSMDDYGGTVPPIRVCMAQMAERRRKIKRVDKPNRVSRALSASESALDQEDQSPSRASRLLRMAFALLQEAAYLMESQRLSLALAALDDAINQLEGSEHPDPGHSGLGVRAEAV